MSAGAKLTIPGERAALEALLLLARERLATLLEIPLRRRDQKARRPDRRIVNRVIGTLAEVGPHTADDGTDGLARGEVLARALLLGGELLQKALVGFGLQVHVELGPLSLIDEQDEFLEVDRLAELGERPGEDVAQQALLLAEFVERD